MQPMCARLQPGSSPACPLTQGTTISLCSAGKRRNCLPGQPQKAAPVVRCGCHNLKSPANDMRPCLHGLQVLQGKVCNRLGAIAGKI